MVCPECKEHFYISNNWLMEIEEEGIEQLFDGQKLTGPDDTIPKHLVANFKRVELPDTD